MKLYKLSNGFGAILRLLPFLQENKDLGTDNALIGQFGVGFYSAFLVAEKVKFYNYCISCG